MKRVALVVTLALTLPLAAWANSSVGSANTGQAVLAAGLNRSFPDGVLFAGKFSGPSNWAATYNPTRFGVSERRQAPLNLRKATPVTGLSTVNVEAEANDRPKPTGNGLELGSGPLMVTVPEPGTLGLLGTGLLAIAGLIRRQLKNRG
jgi:hypothetical protein